MTGPVRRRIDWTGAALVAAVAVLLAVAGAAALATPAAAAATDPALAALEARLEADAEAARERLAEERGELVPLVRRQREQAAELGRTEALRAQLESLAGSLPAGVAEVATEAVEDDEELSSAIEDARVAEQRASERLEAATEQAAEAQAAADDATRRLGALQRAAAMEDAVDPDLGSFLFGGSPRPVTAASIDEYLAAKGSPLAGQGGAFLRSGLANDVDPRLLVAIAGAESYFGVITCAPHNAWGWGCPNGPFRFDDWAEGIEAVARGLRSGYLDDGLTSVGRIHLRYAPPAAANDPTGLNYAWPENVARFLVEQGGDPEDVTGERRRS